MSTAIERTSQPVHLFFVFNKKATLKPKAVVVCPDGKDVPLGRSTSAISSGIASNGRSLFTISFKNPSQISAERPNEIRAKKAPLRVFLNNRKTIPSVSRPISVSY